MKLCVETGSVIVSKTGCVIVCGDWLCDFVYRLAKCFCVEIGCVIVGSKLAVCLCREIGCVTVSGDWLCNCLWRLAV